MKKLLIGLFILCGVFFMSVSPLISFANSLPNEVRVIFNQARVYSTTNFDEIETQEDVEGITIFIVSLHDVFVVIDEEENFYEIELENEQTGFIQKNAVIDNSLSSPEIFLQTNAYALTNSSVYEKINNTFVMLNSIQIEKNQRVRILEGYDMANQFTFVSFENEGHVYSYYVKTNQIKPDGIDRSILLAITLITIAISAGGILMKIFKPKPKNLEK